MSKIDEIEEKISNLYKSGEQIQNVDIPRFIQAQSWCTFSKEFMGAATKLDQYGSQFILPRLQLTGQAIEVALKAYLLSSNIEPSRTHNLIALYKDCERAGFELEEKYLAAIVHLQHYYFSDLATETKFKSRYPTNNNEVLGGALPYNETYVSIVNILLDQAKNFCSQNTQKIVSSNKQGHQ